jgi:hypothetical protein
MTAERIVLIILGALALLVSVPFICGGAAVLLVNSAITDNEGYICADTIHLDSDSYAIVATPDDMDGDSDWFWWLGRFADLKIEGASHGASGQIFIGIADAQDVEEYLDDVSYDEMVEFSTEASEIAYDSHTGDHEPVLPTNVSFWAVSAYGFEKQTIVWEHELDDYSLVIMNAEGTDAVDVRMDFCVKIPQMGGFGVGILITGIVFLIIGILMIFFALRKRGTPLGPSPKMIIVDE